MGLASFVVVVAVVLRVYMSTLHASIPGGDSGELVAAAVELSLPHPTGYPQYVLLNHVLLTKAEPVWALVEPAMRKGFKRHDDNSTSAEDAGPDYARMAWRANAVSALCGALAAGVMSQATLGLVQLSSASNSHSESASEAGSELALFASEMVAIGVSVAFALSPLVWQYSVGAEVFSLNNLNVAVLLWLTVRYGTAASAARGRWAALGALWCGVALCNHHTAVLFEAPLILWILLHEWQWGGLGVGRLGAWGLLFLTGLLPYLYLPWTQLRNTVQQGSWGDTTTLSGFAWHVRRGDYGTFRLYSGGSAQGAADQALGFFDRVGLYVEDLETKQGAYLLPMLSLVAAAYTLHQNWPAALSLSAGGSTRRQKRILRPPQKQQAAQKGQGGKASQEAQEAAREAAQEAEEEEEARRAGLEAALLGALVTYVVVFHYLSNIPLDQELLRGVQARFWMQPNMLVFMLAGRGVGLLRSAAGAGLAQGAPGAGSSSALGVLLALLVAVGALAVPALQFLRFGADADQSGNAHLEHYALALAAPVPEGAVLVVNYDQAWTALRYLQACAGFRPDLTVLSGPMMTYAWFGGYAAAYNDDVSKCVAIPKTGALVHSATAAGTAGAAGRGFSVRQLLEANFESCPGGVWVVGKLPFENDVADYNATIGAEAIGLANRFAPRGELGDFDAWFEASFAAWTAVHAELRGLPNLRRFSPATWEWTVHRDYFDHIYDDAARVLETAIAQSDPSLLVFAATFLELGYIQDKAGMKAGSLKNLGLAFVKIVEAKVDVVNDVAPHAVIESQYATYLRLIFGRSLDEDADGPSSWKNVCAGKAVKYWEEFIAWPGAKDDPSYTQVVDLVSKMNESKEKLVKEARATAQAEAKM